MGIRSGLKGTALQLRIQLLGGFCVWVGETKVPEEQWRLRRSRSLVKLLALAEGHRLHRDQVADALWPDSDLSTVGNNLHQTLHSARKLLALDGTTFLRLEDGFLSLFGGEGGSVWVDVDVFEAGVMEIKARRESVSVDQFEKVLGLYYGDLLPEDRYEDWTVQRREALRVQYQSLLLDLAHRLESKKEYEKAAEVLGRLLTVDRANEEGHTLLMRVLALSGKRGQALRQYQVLREALRVEMEAEPGEGSTRLYEAIQSNRFPPAGSALSEVVSLPTEKSMPRHNLPAQMTSFIGREKEIAAVCELFLTGRARLVTLTGAGGSGKTRLAQRVAEELLDHYKEGVWLVELAPITDPVNVARAIFEALMMVEQPGQDLIKTLIEGLRSRQMLLLLDNCEQFIDGASALVTKLLQGCPGLRILATSREILGVEGELPFRCPSLSLPEGQKDISQTEAVRLFMERARLAQPGFCLSEENVGAIAHICRRLDGIPLAIELAAARLRMLSVEQIAARLDKSFRLLTGGSRSALPRHQTLKALIDWSYHLLSIEEQALLLRLSVFAGGWTLGAAEEVCANPEEEDWTVQIFPDQVMDLLGRLVDKSLVEFTPLHGGLEPRYRMLETIRQFSHDRLLEGGAAEAARDRHLDYFHKLVLQAEPHLRSIKSIEWLDRLERELDNLRLALEWALSGSVKKGLQTASSLHWFWWIRNHYAEGADWLERLLDEQKCSSENRDFTGTVIRGRALLIVNYLCYEFVADPNPQIIEKKKAWWEEGQAIFEELGNAYQKEFPLYLFNKASQAANRLESYLECHDLFQKLNQPFWVAECDTHLSFLYPPNDERALFYSQEHLALTREIGDVDGEGLALWRLGIVEFYRGNLDRAENHLLESIKCFENVGNQLWVTDPMFQLVIIAIAYGDCERALNIIERAFVFEHRLPSQLRRIDLLSIQGFLAWEKGDYAQALVNCQEALRLAENCPTQYRTRSEYVISRVAISQGETAQARANLLDMVIRNDGDFRLERFSGLHGVGILAAREGQMQRAIVLFGAQETQSGWLTNIISPKERSEYHQALAAARAVLGEEAFSAAWERGREMTPAQVKQYMLEGLSGMIY